MGISSSVIKKDHSQKISGSALYVADFPTDGVLFGKLLRSTLPRARILGVLLPPLPEGYLYVDKNDVTGENRVHIVMDDTPVFAEEIVEFIGDPIGMLVGPDEDEVERLHAKINVEYEELDPVFDPLKSDTAFFNYAYSKGDVKKAFHEADKVYHEVFKTGYQEQAYLETQGIIAGVKDGKVTVQGSIQCPYYVHGAVVKALGLDADKVRVKQDVTGGGFGGKEAYPSILACQTAVAAQKAGKPVRVIYGRREDMEFTSKRHPSHCVYKVAVKDGKVTAMDIDVTYDSGAYTTLSAVVLQRGIICASGVYNIENLKIHGVAKKTNTVPSGAMRGFGGPQTFFAVEMMMDHIARDLGRDSVEFKLANLSKQGDATSTGGKYHFPVPIAAMVDAVDRESGFRSKRELYSRPQIGRYRRGIGVSMIFHGAGFTGSGERDIIKAVSRLHKYADGTVEALVSVTDMGQGLKTTLAKIISNELQIPVDKIIVDNPDTDRVPDSGPTVASRSLMIVGELMRRAAQRLKSEWVDGKEQVIEERFKEPDFVIPFYLDKFQGDAYPTFSWAVNAVEVEIDTLTGTSNILGAWGSFDVGTPIDESIVTGQMEGGFMQGIGFGSMEHLTAHNGRIRNNSFGDYIIPTSLDIKNLKILLHVEEYPLGPYGAKGAGELPVVGGAPAYVEAVEQALKTPLNHAPFTADDTMKLLREAGK